jgi:hypothetical protein
LQMVGNQSCKHLHWSWSPVTWGLHSSHNLLFGLQHSNDTMSNLPKIQPLTVMKPQFGLWSSSLLHWPPTTHPTPSLPWSVPYKVQLKVVKLGTPLLKIT